MKNWMNRQSPLLTRRGLLSAAGAATGAAALTACSGGQSVGGGDPSANGGDPASQPAFSEGYDGPKVTLTYWNGLTGGDGDNMVTMVDEFNASHENIEVTTMSMVWADLYSKIVTAVDSGEGPEVALMQLDQLATFAVRGTIIPLDDVVTSLRLTESDFSPSVWAGGVFQEKRYGIPLDMFTIAQYWDKEAFAAAGLEGPINGADEFASAMTALQGGGIGNPFWVPSISPHWQMWLGLLTQFGGQLYDADAEAFAFDSDAGVEALNWMVDLVKTGVSPEGATDIRPALMSGNAAMLTDGLWSIADFSANAPGLDWGIGAYPTIGSRGGAFANSHNFALTKQADADDNIGQASRVFIDWLSTNSLAWANSGNIPARAELRDTDEFQALPQAALNSDEIYDDFVFLPQLPGGRDIGSNTFQAAVAEAVLLQKDPAEALATAQTNAQQQLEENRALYGF